MKLLTMLGALLLIALSSVSACASDLSKLERRIAREPVYQSKAPRYCLLVFGPDMKTRVWLVQDGDTLYVDRNGNGDLTDDGEKLTRKNKEKEYSVFEVGDIRDGPLTHKDLVVTQVRATEESLGSAKEFERVKALGEPWVWHVDVTAERPAGDTRNLPRRIKYVVNGDGQGALAFARRPQDAPIIHFNGAWTLEVQDFKQRLTAGHESMLQIGVGTRGIGPGTFTWVLYADTIPVDAYPVADITFPPRSPGETPITRKYTLKQRC
jgi:hypothetical protein